MTNIEGNLTLMELCELWGGVNQSTKIMTTGFRYICSEMNGNQKSERKAMECFQCFIQDKVRN